MIEPALMAELWRGDFVESLHYGHAVVVDETGQLVSAWGDPGRLIYPRSAAKMLQALPLVESGAADALGLGEEELALACASHSATPVHTTRVAAWLERLALTESDLRCGAQPPMDKAARQALREAGEKPSQLHNNCSGKHCGFLSLSKHLGAGTGPEYLEPTHPVQRAVRSTFEDMAGMDSPGYGIDGCSAPNFVTTLEGFGRALALMAAPERLGGARARAAERLVRAMITRPHLVAGEGRACTELMRACECRAALKTGAEGVFAAILPTAKMAVAIKIDDGATRASEAAIAALLVKVGVLDRSDPVVTRFAMAEDRNRRDILTGHVRAAEGLF